MISKISINDKTIISFHAEQVYMTIKKNIELLHKKGFYVREIDGFLLQAIEEELENITNETENHVILDFQHIDIIEPNIEDQLNKIIEELIKKKESVSLININKKLISCLEIDDIYFENIYKYSNYDIENHKHEILFSKKEDSNIYENRLNKYDENAFGNFYNDIFYEKIKNVLEPPETNLFSSPVYISTYINIKKLVETEIDFIFISCYLIAKNMIKNNMLIDSWEKNTNIVLFCHSLNGACICSVLADILSLNIFFLDHIGPVTKIYRHNFKNVINQNSSYIVVSDVTCLGIEMRIAENIIKYEGGNYIGAVTLLKISTMKTEHKEAYAYLIDKNNNPIDYKMSTDICCLNKGGDD